jgi:uncharacterized protein
MRSQSERRNLAFISLGLAAGLLGSLLLSRRLFPPALPRGESRPGTALITGASSGIGAVFARKLAARGYNLVLVARRQERLEALAELLQHQYSIEVTTLPADLGNPVDLARLEAYLAHLDDLTLLINNAGFGTLEHFVEASLNRQLDMIQVNTMAPIRLTYAALPGMIRRGRGAIINVSSIAAWAATKGNTIYAGTKSFLNAFSASLQTELRGTGVQVQALCPGFTVTEFHDQPGFEGFKRSHLPASLWMSSEAVVQASLQGLTQGQEMVIPGLLNRLAIGTIQTPVLGGLLLAILRRSWEN